MRRVSSNRLMKNREGPLLLIAGKRSENTMRSVQMKCGVRLGLLFMAVALCMGVLWPSQAFSRNANPGIIPPNARYGGHTYAQWNAIYVDQVMQGQLDGFQMKNIYFLPVRGLSPAEPIHVAIPTGNAVMVMVLATLDPDKEWVETGDTDAVTESYSLNDFREIAATGRLFCEIDGVAVQNIEDYVVAAPLLAPFWDPIGEVQYQWALGCYFLLSPLTPGSHTIHIYDFIPEWGGYTLEMTYDIEVVQGKQ
jgi:hypothetical protein